jgi:hypothetical protein
LLQRFPGAAGEHVWEVYVFCSTRPGLVWLLAGADSTFF